MITNNKVINFITGVLWSIPLFFFGAILIALVLVFLDAFMSLITSSNLSLILFVIFSFLCGWIFMREDS